MSYQLTRVSSREGNYTFGNFDTLLESVEVARSMGAIGQCYPHGRGHWKMTGDSEGTFFWIDAVSQ